MESGVVKTYNPDRGFGFITPADGTEDVFLHARELADKAEADVLNRDVLVCWERTEYGPKGPRAVRVRVQQGGGAGSGWLAPALQRVFDALDDLITEARSHGMDV